MKMLGKIKKLFFTGIFGVLYLSYIAQFAYVLIYLRNEPYMMMISLAMLAVEWLVLISARYLSKKSSNSAQAHSNSFRRR
jgi:hypothetical protein